jgi:Domain of unknown function (DUF4365)
VIKISATPKVERMGVSALEYMVSSFGWAYRSQEIEDYGIDGHIEPFDETDRPSGHLIAVQVKSGSSYFEKTNGGWYFRGDQAQSKKKPKKEDKHLQYWLGHVLPVIIVMYDPATKALHWALVTEERVEFTDRGWRTLIPEQQVLDDSAIPELREIANSAHSAKSDPLTASIPLLPPSVATTLESAYTTAPAGAMRLARMLAKGRYQPELTAETALAAQPSWLSSGNGQFEAAIGAFANDHGYPALAQKAFTRSAEYGGPFASRLFAIAALLAMTRADVAAAAGLVDQAEAAGGGGLFLEITRATLTDLKNASPEMSAVRAILASSPRETIESEPTLMLYLGQIAVQRLDFDEALGWFDAALVIRSAMTGALLGKAQALISKVGNGKSVLAVRDRGEARQLAEQALAEMRRWAGPSELALEVLLTTHMMIGAFRATVSLATPQALGGSALDREAAYGPVAIIGAQAALALGDRGGAEGFAALVAGTDAEDLIRPLLLDPALPDADKAAAWRTALTASAEPIHQRRAAYRLAALGQLTAEDLEAPQVALNFDAAHRDVLLARSEAARGRIQQAVIALRRYSATNPAAAEMLVEVLANDGQFDAAVAECDRSIARFGADKIAHDKLNLLVRAGRVAEAHAFAATLLAGQDLEPEQRITLRQRLIGHSAQHGDWATMEQQCRDAYAAHPEQSDFVWNLIAAQANQGRFEAAWATLGDLHPAVDDPAYVPVWLDLHGRFGFAESDVEAALDFAVFWPESGTAVFTALLEGAGSQRPDGRLVLPAIRDGLRDRFQRELSQLAERGSQGPIRITAVSPTEFLEKIRSQLTSETGRLDHAAALVRTGRLPLAALAAQANRPYAQMLIERACGALFASTADTEQFERERAAAREALNGRVAVETSALHLGALIPERWETLRAVFAEVRLPRQSLADIEAARRELVRAPGTSYTVAYRATTDALVLGETEPADHQRQHNEAIGLDRIARSVFIADSTEDLNLPAAHLPWVAPINLAARENLSLWSDDVALRLVAVGLNIPVFGTIALMSALVEDGLIADTLRDDALLLAQAGVVDLGSRV